MESWVKTWLERTAKKGPFFLYRREPITGWRAERYPDGQKYWLIWRETIKGSVKTKFGWVQDGMYAASGLETQAVLAGTAIVGLWQNRANAIDENELQAMLDVANDRTDLPIFDLSNIKDIQ